MIFHGYVIVLIILLNSQRVGRINVLSFRSLGVPWPDLGTLQAREISWAAFVPGSHVGLWLVWQLYFPVFIGLGITSIQEVGIKFLARIKWNEACERCITMLNFTKSAGEFFHNLCDMPRKTQFLILWYAEKNAVLDMPSESRQAKSGLCDYKSNQHGELGAHMNATFQHTGAIGFHSSQWPELIILLERSCRFAYNFSLI